MRFKVGVCQFNPELFNVSRNLAKMESLLSDVSADLIVLPELAASGYVFRSKAEVSSCAEQPQNGPTAQLFKALAKQNKTSYVVGFAEKAKAGLYNSSMLVNPDGKINIYRKTHLFFEEKKWFMPGDTGFKVFTIKGSIKVGLMICFDWIFPESARSLALAGAQIVAHSANLVLPWCQQAMITRSLENRIFSVTSNRTGLEKNGTSKLKFTGMSQIIDPTGKIVSRMNETEEYVVVKEINPLKADDKNVTEYNNLFTDRRTELYLS
ncbi:MAG: beta-ureidopropionase [Candidatus Cloacimonetes bacterium]|nr:beta-ureidopropionase [Candidatus Cloacimonadota bacterium]